MDPIARGDLVFIVPHSSLYPAAYTSPGARTSGDRHIPGLVVEAEQFYVRVLFGSGATAWIHNCSCRPARKADRT